MSSPSSPLHAVSAGASARTRPEERRAEMRMDLRMATFAYMQHACLFGGPISSADREESGDRRRTLGPFAIHRSTAAGQRGAGALQPTSASIFEPADAFAVVHIDAQRMIFVGLSLLS